MTVTLASDTFTRANQSAWGTASDGEVWSVAVGGAGNFSIVSNQGKITGSTSVQVAFLGSATFTDGEALVRVNTTAAADTPSVLLRATASNTYYRARYNASNFSIERIISGALSTIKSTAFTWSPGS